MTASKNPSFADMANAIRFLSADGVQKANSGHPGMPMGMAEVATVLFTRYLKFDAQAPDWADRDRFVLSAGHGSMLLYSLLYLTGFPGMTLDELKAFRQLGSKTAGHPEYGHAAGIETTTGPLGQGITTAVGMALAERMLAARYGDGLVDHYTYVIAGDGCLMEGISHEAISFAGHHKLGKLVVFWDDNSICIDGPTDLSVTDDQIKRFEASGWHCQAIDGHDADAIAAAIEAAKADPRPSMIACKTIIGKGAPNKGGTASTHGSPLGDEELDLARKACNWPFAPFEVPSAVLSTWMEAGSRGATDRQAWEGRLAALADGGAAFKAQMAGDLPAKWEEAVIEHKKMLSYEKPKLATRQASGKALEVLTAEIETLIGGSADLTGSVNTKTKATPSVTTEDYTGRYIHWGVREFGMAAMMNGMALHGGFIPYGGTFLVFADYMKGAMRLSALMGQKVIYVLTHDSIGLGEDGPTHQPVETLASLRSLPNFTVYRPADAVEAAECWALALKDKSGPSGMVLSRQGLPTVRVAHTDDNLCARGGYVLAEADGERQVTIIATGSEVAIALDAREKLAAEGVKAAVVSLPSFELFEAQDAAYRKSVLGSAPRIGIEAAVSFGWDRYLGENGTFIGMNGFGASAPAPQLYAHFGLTAEAIVTAAKAKL